MAYTVYCHTFPNGKKYIGITRQDVRRRWREGRGYIGQPVFDAIIKYGWDNIKHEILYEGLTKEDAEQKEIELIKLHKTKSHENGYNIENGGDASEISEETKERLRQSRKEYYKTHEHWNKGKHWSEETKAKISKSHTGKKRSEDEKQAMSERFSGTKNPMYGTKIPPEHKKKLQAACVKARSKACICIETGETFDSVADAGRKTGVNSRNILYVCQKQGYYKTAGGYHWEFIKKEA